MLQPRIIPCLLVHKRGLVKTVKFKDPKYVGDPINAVRIFNEKEVDELTVIDIDSTVLGKEPDYDFIKKIAAECRMPLCYGGGVKTVEQFQKIISLGVEKVAISSEAINNPEIISKLAEKVGNQSVVVIIDVKKGFLGGYEVFTHNGKKKASVKLIDFIKKVEELGAGEIVINSITNDGVMKGYDMNLVNQVREVTTLPLTVLGGAGSYDDLSNLIKEHRIIGASAGSLFVFKGKYRAVLISYPNREEKENILETANYSVG